MPTKEKTRDNCSTNNISCLSLAYILSLVLIYEKRVEIGPGTLYTILSKFEQSEYIEEIAVEGRKRTYQITDIGKKAYVKEKSRLYQMLDDAAAEEMS